MVCIKDKKAVPEPGRITGTIPCFGILIPSGLSTQQKYRRDLAPIESATFGPKEQASFPGILHFLPVTFLSPVLRPLH
jgi:hypothetical protein